MGLGKLGTACAERLASNADLAVQAWNRTEAPVPGGVTWCADVGRAVDGCDAVLLCLRDSHAVQEVLFERGAVAAARRDTPWIDLTTHEVDVARRLHNMVRKAGGRYLEAPVAGSVMPALRGELTMLVVGEDQAYETCSPVLTTLARTVFRLPEPGHATQLKLLNNFVLAGFLKVLGECAEMGKAWNLDPCHTLQVLAAGAGDGTVLRGKLPRLLSDDFRPHFTASLLEKDLRALRRALGDPAHTDPLGATIEHVARFSRAPFAELDIAALLDPDRALRAMVRGGLHEGGGTR